MLPAWASESESNAGAVFGTTAVPGTSEPANAAPSVAEIDALLIPIALTSVTGRRANARTTPAAAALPVGYAASPLFAGGVTFVATGALQVRAPPLHAGAGRVVVTTDARQLARTATVVPAVLVARAWPQAVVAVADTPAFGDCEHQSHESYELHPSRHDRPPAPIEIGGLSQTIFETRPDRVWQESTSVRSRARTRKFEWREMQPFPSNKGSRGRRLGGRYARQGDSDAPRC